MYIMAHERRQCCIDDRGRKSLVFSIFRIHIRGLGYSNAGQRVFQGGGGSALVCIIYVRVQETDRNGGNTLPFNVSDNLIDVSLIEVEQNVSAVVDAFPNAKAVFALNERLWALDKEVVKLASILPPDFDDITKAGGCDERNARQRQADLSEQRIGRDRRRMANHRNLRIGMPRLKAAQRIEYRFGRFGGCRWQLDR